MGTCGLVQNIVYFRVWTLVADSPFSLLVREIHTPHDLLAQQISFFQRFHLAVFVFSFIWNPKKWYELIKSRNVQVSMASSCWPVLLVQTIYIVCLTVEEYIFSASRWPKLLRIMLSGFTSVILSCFFVWKSLVLLSKYDGVIHTDC